MTRHRPGPLLTAILGISVLLLATSAHARAPDARVLEARRACASGKVERGIELLAEIIAERNDPNAVYNQARCYQANGRPEQAIARFREYLRMSPKLPDKEIDAVTVHLRDLEQELDARARRAALASPPPPARTAPTNPNQAALRLGAATAPAPADGGGSRALFIASAVTAAIGVAALATGAFYSLETRRIERQVERQSLPLASEMHQRRIQAGERAQRRQWIGYGMGAAALGASGAMFFFGRF